MRCWLLFGCFVGWWVRRFALNLRAWRKGAAACSGYVIKIKCGMVVVGRGLVYV